MNPDVWQNAAFLVRLTFRLIPPFEKEKIHGKQSLPFQHHMRDRYIVATGRSGQNWNE
jgi:hypothetical protein